MGEVYRARDTRLGREVAVKVLPPAFAADSDRLARFEREARATAGLDHPNILAVFDVGTHDGTPYLVEQLLEGESLRARLQRGPLAARDAVALAVQVAQGLAEAHEKRVVHRDLKPENVFLTREGPVKILDVGLAKLVEAAPASEAGTLSAVPGATALGQVLGTAGYMAPEQARGTPVDHRADLFAFGVVLYEMLSGTRPFRGATYTDTVVAILTHEPPQLPDSVPPALQAIVGRCLEKSPTRRYQSSRDLVQELQALQTEASRPPALATMPAPRSRRARRALWATAFLVAAVALAGGLLVRSRGTTPPAAAPRPTRLVVLPFENLGSPEDAYFAAGMADEITSRLAGVHGLAVTSRTSAVGYPRAGKTIPQIGHDLGVDYVLEGSVRWQRGSGRDSRVRITPQLVRVADDTPVWSDRYDRVIADVFAIQAEVADNVVRATGVRLVPAEPTAANEIPTRDMEAYDLYLRGLATARTLGYQNRQAMDGALQLFQAAADRDPRFALALAQLARTHLSIYFYHDRFRRPVDRTHVDGARDVLDRLRAIGPDLAETQVALGYYAYYGLADYETAGRAFTAAQRLQPSNSEAASGLGYILRRQGRWEEAAEQLRLLLDLDPRNPEVSLQLGVTYTFLRRYAEADRVLEAAERLSPQLGAAWGRRAWLQVIWRGDVERAASLLAEARRVPGLEDDVEWVAYGSFRVALIQLDVQAALRHLEGEKHEAFSNQFLYQPVELLRAHVRAVSGRPDDARRSFEAARRRLEELSARQPGDARYHSALGIACAGLGLREQAEREAKRGVDLTPASADAWLALWRIEDLALVHAMLGQQDQAIERLQLLLSQPSEVSATLLRLDPRWQSLRSNPRFQALLSRYAAG
jgi:TolB-like protein/Flp pilus assembly protein TadD